MFRAGIWKPRTHPGSFEGVGAPGLKWLKKVKEETGMFVCTEVANEKHVYECLKYGVDLLWIGARTTANPFLMQEIADALRDTDIPVLVKNPVNPDLDLWIGALERLNQAGVRKLGVIHRGFSTTGSKPYRNAPGWQIAIELRTRYPDMPFFADPSHMGGDRKYLQELSQRAMDLGLEGLMIESHCNPAAALSDAKQQLIPEDLRTLIESLIIREKDSGDKEYREGIEQLRSRIDYIDEDLLKELGARMEVSRKIGAYKRDHNVAILQMSRWDVVMAAMKEKARVFGLSEKFVEDVFNAIHEESVRTQNEVLSGGPEA
jgi:chorismate mutase